MKEYSKVSRLILSLERCILECREDGCDCTEEAEKIINEEWNAAISAVLGKMDMAYADGVPPEKWWICDHIRALKRKA